MKLPKYAEGLPKNKLVSILCRGKCNCGDSQTRLIGNAYNPASLCSDCSEDSEIRVQFGVECAYVAVKFY